MLISWEGLRVPGRGLKHPLRRRWQYLGFSALRAVVRWWPLPIAQAVGALCGYAAYAAAPGLRRAIWANLRVAFGPELSRKVRYRISRGVCANLGSTVFEWFVIDRLSPRRLHRMVEVQGLQNLERALAKGRGVIVLSGHFGNWELMPMVVTTYGYRGGVLARRLRYPEYEAFLFSMRRRKGVTTYERGSLKDVARLLRENHIIGMMPDQDIDSLDGVFVDFFGRQAYTPVGPAALSLMTGALIVPMFITRLGRRFRLTIEEPLAVARTGDRARDLVLLTQAWSRTVEAYIRCYPDHWVWMHRRWKTRPAASKADPAPNPAPAP